MRAFLGCPETPLSPSPPPTPPPGRTYNRSQDFSKPEAVAVDDAADELADQLAALNVFARPSKNSVSVDKEGDSYMAIAQARPKALVSLTSLAKPVSTLSLALAAMSLSGTSSKDQKQDKKSLGNPFLRVGMTTDKGKSKGKDALADGDDKPPVKMAPRRKKTPVSCFIQPKRQVPKPAPQPRPASPLRPPSPSYTPPGSPTPSCFLLPVPSPVSEAKPVDTSGKPPAPTGPVTPPPKRTAVIFPPGVLKIAKASPGEIPFRPEMVQMPLTLPESPPVTPPSKLVQMAETAETAEISAPVAPTVVPKPALVSCLVTPQPSGHSSDGAAP
ncbi:hypothetical protein SCUCBS95973_005381 [Sporothrix curviconia]|uniref:Uncharacterized protein n=1 Tax=Sporothrix curviconia TaxID=1260050 RepID=A0ABP0BWR9_9PEZI